MRKSILYKTFFDHVQNAEAFVLIDVCDGLIDFTVSVETDGDASLFLGRTECHDLLKALSCDTGTTSEMRVLSENDEEPLILAVRKVEDFIEIDVRTEEWCQVRAYLPGNIVEELKAAVRIALRELTM